MKVSIVDEFIKDAETRGVATSGRAERPKMVARPAEKLCRVCHSMDFFEFRIDPQKWNLIVPKMFRRLRVCLSCFDSFAAKRQVEYGITDLVFNGPKMQASFRVSMKVSHDKKPTKKPGKRVEQRKK